MVVRQRQLVSHFCGYDFRFVGFGCFIVQNLVLGHDALLFMRSSTLQRANMIYPSTVFFVVSTSVQFLSMLYALPGSVSLGQIELVTSLFGPCTLCLWVHIRLWKKRKKILLVQQGIWLNFFLGHDFYLCL